MRSPVQWDCQKLRDWEQSMLRCWLWTDQEGIWILLSVRQLCEILIYCVAGASHIFREMCGVGHRPQDQGKGPDEQKNFGVGRSDDEQHRLPACSFSLLGEAFRQFQKEVVFYMRKKLFLSNPPAIPDFLHYVTKPPGSIAG